MDFVHLLFVAPFFDKVGLEASPSLQTMEVFFMSNFILKDEYANEDECKAAIAKYNEGKKPEDEMRYCSYLNTLTKKRMYVPCTIEYFFAWRNMMAEEHRKRDLETRCLVPSERYSYHKKCMEDCAHCPYGKDHRDGGVLSLDKFREENEYEIADEHISLLDEIIEEQRRDALIYEISLLDEESQQILSLFNKGYTDAEIGVALGLKRSTVQYRKTCLIEDLRKKLKNF